MKLKNALIECRQQKKAILAVNFYNFETLKADLIAANENHSAIILQTSESTLQYLGIPTAVAMARSLTADFDVQAWIHLDHGMDINLIKRCLDAGYDSVMIDASELSLEHNIEKTCKVVELARPYDINVEAEIGYIAKLNQSQEIICTPPDLAARFVSETGVDALAIAIGNAHGFYNSSPKLHFDILQAISEVVSIPLVLHGSSGIPIHDLLNAIRLGICKINLATEIKNAFMKEIKSIIVNSDEIDLRIIFPHAIKVTAELIGEKLKGITNE